MPIEEIHAEPGWRRADHLLQKRIEKVVEQHDEHLRRKYLTETKK